MTQKLLDLFRAGKDTLTIARELRKSEAWVYAAIHRERCLEKGDTAHEDYRDYRHNRHHAAKKERERRRDHRKEYLQKMAARGKRPLVKFPGDDKAKWVPA
jgi:hypothetical protein